MRQIIINSPSEITSTKPYNLSQDGSSLTVSSSIYLNLGSVTKNLTLGYSKNPVNSYREFINDMDDFSNDIEPEDDSHLEALIETDSFLSSLGIDTRYPIKSDISNAFNKMNIKFRTRG